MIKESAEELLSEPDIQKVYQTADEAKARCQELDDDIWKREKEGK